MINLPLITYFLFLFLFLGAVLAVIYHLRVNKLNEKISILTTLIFIVGFLLILTFNVSNAIQVDWDLLSFDFSGIPGNLEFKNPSYE